MATTNAIYARTFAAFYPRTNEPFQRLIMAAADAGKNAGKKSWFGKDKGQESFAKFMNILTRDVALALVEDGQVSDPCNPKEVLLAVMKAKGTFQEAYPNWQDAYRFMDWFYTYSTGDE